MTNHTQEALERFDKKFGGLAQAEFFIPGKTMEIFRQQRDFFKQELEALEERAYNKGWIEASQYFELAGDYDPSGMKIKES